MIYKRFYISIIIRVVLILLTCFLVVISFPSQKLFLIINHSILLIVQVYLLIRYINRVNYDLSNFIDSCIGKDYNLLKYPNHKGKSYERLYTSLSAITDALKKSEIETIFKSQYLYTAIQNVGAGLIWIDERGDVVLINKSAKVLFNILNLNNIKELEKISSSLPDLLRDIKPSENKLIKIYIENELKQISIKATELIQQGKHIKLIALHDIKNELDEAELDSWQKLIRVLAHEIMNSIGSITTSSTAISKYFKSNQGEHISTSDISDKIISNTIEGLDIIRERSVGLKDFVNNYRQLTNLPAPDLKEFEILPFIENLGIFFKEEFQQKNIQFEIVDHHKNLKILADKKLISHVFINLIKNASEAIGNEKEPIITIEIDKNTLNQVFVNVKDNGHGISEEVIDRIFIPFFTTKEEGSGIGLSLSRQIMRLHNGSINVKSNHTGTEFQLLF